MTIRNTCIKIVFLLALSCSAFFYITGCSGGKPVFNSIDHLLSREIPEDFLKENAVVLLEEERMEIAGSKAIHEYRLVKKILKSGYPEEGAFSFGEDKYHKILSIQARAIYPDGRERVIAPEDIKIVANFPGFILYSDEKSRVFRFPGVKAGTVIEVVVRTEINNLVYWSPALFQRDEPILTRRYTLIHPKDLDYNIYAVGISDIPDSKTSIEDGREKLIWESFDIAPFEYEEMMPPREEYIPSLRFSVHKDLEFVTDLRLDSWADIVEWYEKITENSLKRGTEVKQLVSEVCPPNASDEENARRLFKWVQENLRYVAIVLGDGGYIPHENKEAISNRYGDCKDQAVVLASALREAGINAHIVLVRTTDLGHLEMKIPCIGYFNHAIVAAVINGDIIYLDPTCDNCSFGVLPYSDQDAEALLIKDGENSIIKLPIEQLRPNSYEISSKVTINKDGKAKIISTLEFDGYHAVMARRRFIYRSGKSISEVAADLFTGGISSSTIEDIKITGESSELEKLTVKIIYLIPDFLDTKKKTAFIQAVFHPIYFDLPESSNRVYPVVLGKKRSLKYEMSMELPEQWRVLEIPSSGETINDHFEYVYTWESDKRNIFFSRSWSAENCLIPAENYPEIRKQLKTVMKNEGTKVLVSR